MTIRTAADRRSKPKTAKKPEASKPRRKIGGYVESSAGDRMPPGAGGIGGIGGSPVGGGNVFSGAGISAAAAAEAMRRRKDED